MPYNSWADVVRLLAELGGFQFQLQASYVSSHTEELWYNSLSVDENIYIYCMKFWEEFINIISDDNV